MRKIISSIDIGSDSVKLIVGELYQNRLHILGASKVKNGGIEKGKIIDENRVIGAIKKAVREASNTLGLEIKRSILCIDMMGAKLSKGASAIQIKSEDHIIGGDDISALLNKCADGKVPQDHGLISVVPVEFTIDGDKVVDNPLGKKSENLGLKAIIISSPKDYVSSLLEIANKAGLKIIDVVPNAIGDYYSNRSEETSSSLGAIINVGATSTSVSIFNRGIITNTYSFPLGGWNIVRDIGFVSKIDDLDSEAVYEDLVLASSRLANPKEYRVLVNLDGEEFKVNQYDLSEIAASRIEEILNLAKKQINNLTKKEISYIIITGGLTELKDFDIAVDDFLGKNAIVGKLKIIGARDNSFSSAVGIINYFNEKLELKGKTFSIFSNGDLEDMSRDKFNTNNNSLLDKVLGIFFDN